jgi:sugar phosphate isomerase/epimerase
MKIGFPNHPRREILAEIEWIGAHGFGFVDLFLEADQATVEQIDPLRIREALDRLGLDAVGHLAWYLPIGSPLRQLRRAAVEITREYLEALARIGVPAATIHADWPRGSLFSAAEGLAWQIESLRELLKIGQDLGVRIMYEPIDTARDTPANLKTILTKLPDLLCHLDLGHCNLFGKKPEEMIRRFATRLHHVHLHDNTGAADLHLPPGAGTIAWPAVLRALKEVGYDRTITLEVFSPDRDYVLLAKQKIEALWNQEGITSPPALPAPFQSTRPAETGPGGGPPGPG